MARSMRLLLLIGIGLLILGALYLVISFLFFGYRLSPIDFIVMGMAFIGFVMAWPTFEDDYKKNLGSSANEKCPPSPQELPTTTSQSDIDDFCKSVIAWKVSATKKDEIFQLFKDNPYYLMGYLAYLTKRDIEETKDLQRRTFAFMFISIIVGYGTLIIAIYALTKEFIVPGLIVSMVVLLMIIYTSLTWKSILRKSH